MSDKSKTTHLGLEGLISATKDGIVYPSLDPCIFELKYPNTDIQGRVIGDS